MKNHSHDLHSPLCGEFIPNLVNIARYASQIWDKFSTNCEVHLTESIFQTRSRANRRAWNKLWKYFDVEEFKEECFPVGGEIGSVFGRTGRVVGTVVGGIIGAGVGLVKGVFDTFTGGCYITTAVCEEYGKPDDCYELAAFRKFRDGWLSEQPDGAELIGRYYNTAPAIVDLINKQENRAEIYRGLNEKYLSKCLGFIENDEYKKCKETYVQMMEYLFKEQDKWK